MRFLTVSHFFAAHGGGIERVAGHLGRALRLQGHTVQWAASDEDAPPALDTAEAVPLRCSSWIEQLTSFPMPIPGLQALRRLYVAVGQAETVIVHDSLYLTSIAAVLFARRARKPVILIQHIARIPFTRRIMRGAMWAADRLVTHPMLRAADQVVFISAVSRDAFHTVSTRRPPILLFNGVDNSVFHPRPGETRAETLGGLGLSADKPTLLFVGRFVAKKGLGIMRALAEMHPELQVVMAGQGPIAPEDWRLANVTVARDRSGTTLADLYRATDALILPSFGEGFPLVVQEAMTCGTRILCDAGSARADPAATPWLCGVSVDPADPKGTAEAFATAFARYNLKGSDRVGMTSYAASTYSWPGMAAAIARLAADITRQR